MITHQGCEYPFRCANPVHPVPADTLSATSCDAVKYVGSF